MRILAAAHCAQRGCWRESGDSALWKRHALGVSYRRQLVTMAPCSDFGVNKFGAGVFAMDRITPGALLARIPLHACVSPLLLQFLPTFDVLVKRWNPQATNRDTTR
jgi:hypothetical protein